MLSDLKRGIKASGKLSGGLERYERVRCNSCLGMLHVSILYLLEKENI